ncbi:MAG: ribonuclease HI [Anaerolineae bacterium]|nr:ribonuclease HI [Anaerolineae bacterium]
MSDDKPHVTIFTDGGADPNPGPGGWGVVLINNATDTVKELSGGEPDTTNNRMELMAAICALESLTRPSVVDLFTDSQYLRRGITEWLPDWEARGWRRKGGAIQNIDLWQRLAELIGEHEIAWEWVKGHAGNRYNERADRLATRAIRAYYAGVAGQEPAQVEVFLVVSARGNKGMWAASIRSDGGEQMLSGHEAGVTANQLDIMAAARALGALPEGVSARVYSLSDYLRNGASQWLPAWKRRGWKTKEGQLVKNRELWQRLDAELSTRQVEWPPAKDDPALEGAFEDLGRRAQEEFEPPHRPDDWVDVG